MRILVIEDDRKAAQLLARGLREEGLVVDLAYSSQQAEALLRAAPPMLIILDWALPGQDGLSYCAELRARGVQTPILMLTARDSLDDRVHGLNHGADDYLTKPFAFEELLARLRALLRRSEMTRPPQLRYADLLLDPVSHRVSRGDLLLDLRPREYAILELLMRRAGETLPRHLLARQLWSPDQVALDNLIDVHISNLRKKVDLPDLPTLIHTVRGRGYRLGEPS